jgi:hypothetical protein
MVDWGDVPTWVTAGVALAALVAAVRAYQDQSAGLAKQAEAVELQRQQLTDLTRLQEREQANAVDVELRSIDGAQAQVLSLDKSEPVPMLVVTNSSRSGPSGASAASCRQLEATIRSTGWSMPARME